MTTSSLPDYLILSELDLSSSHGAVSRKYLAVERAAKNFDSWQSDEQAVQDVTETDCACTDGRSQSIILISKKR